VDRKFVWATANIIAPDTIEVYDATVQQPVAVRYVWARYPESNLVNKEGLPASPFRTDSFPGITFDNE
jgi:sialate O-acetylesterase